jgi:dipeptidyl aminopeptidase/acylaminoacyl peptidase
MTKSIRSVGLALALALAGSAGAQPAGGASTASGATAAGAVASQAAGKPAHDPLVVPFMSGGLFRNMTLSPDGKHIAALVYNGYTYSVGLIDTATMKMEYVTVGPRVNLGISWTPHVPLAVHWIADDLLAVNFNSGAAVVDIQGHERSMFAMWMDQVRDASGAFTDWALVRRKADEPKGISRFNVRTGENYSVDIDLAGSLVGWKADARGDIRLATMRNTAFWSDSTRVSTWYRDSVEEPWHKIEEHGVLEDAFVPLQISDHPGHLVVQSRNGGDRMAIWDYDIAGKRFGAQMAADPTDDIVGAETTGDERLLDVVTDGLKPHRTWFDPKMARLQASLDATLPDNVNLIGPLKSGKQLVYSYSDVEPGHWYLFEPAAMKMQDVALALPDIDPKRMQPMRALRYPSFDGTSIPAYLTLPGKPAGPAPLIVLIHGGPQARDRWAFDRDVQVFAAHGYAVFQPQFRGSTGFGRKFEEAGYGQWGQAMQDDITAGVHWLIDQKIADPARICIVGASYGGYAALWGLEKTPELYKCGVSTAGVVDIQRLLKADSDSNESAVAREAMHSRISNPELMKVPFDSVSPLKHADRITAPLLLVHGKLDRRVPISEGEAMLAQMQRLGKDVQWLQFDNEGHGVTRVGNIEQWYAQMFALFERTIGQGVPPLAPSGTPVQVPAEPAPLVWKKGKAQ